MMRLRVLTWNVMHGRAQPSAGRDLRREFTAALNGWEWDVALLQEVPPWWPARLGAELEAEYRFVLTSRNGLLSARRAIATRWPDLIRSNGGGANAILARHDRIVTHRTLRLARFPERRWAQGAWLACGFWVVNVHASGDELRAQRDSELTASTSLQWAAGAPWSWAVISTCASPPSTGCATPASAMSTICSSATASRSPVRPRCSTGARCRITRRWW